MKIINYLKIACAFCSLEATASSLMNDKNVQDEPETIQTAFKLDTDNRPEQLKSVIDSAFDSIAKGTSSEWGLYNGSDGYDMMDYLDKHFLKNLIMKLPEEQDTCTFLDIGAGNFQWGGFIVKHLLAQTDLPSHLRHIRIISIRGEENLEPEIIQGTTESQQICITKYNFGHFKIENLSEEFRKKNLTLDSQIDFVVSHWCFRHLVDPIGTFQQAYNLLKPDQGIFMGDGFLFSMDNQGIGKFFENNRMMRRILLSTKAPFIIKPHEYTGSLDRFVIKRSTNTQLTLPLTYNKAIEVGFGYQISSNHITDFNGELPNEDFDLDNEEWDRDKGLLGNDQKFFEEITTVYPYNYLKRTVKKVFFGKMKPQ